mmetsp:Transcript_3487/g.7653  ORF Transcript_3487/g.7653 Transcript_3487/m.7653 type:complete len:203 (-) Transcript_3487:1715-2323(-)
MPTPQAMRFSKPWTAFRYPGIGEHDVHMSKGSGNISAVSSAAFSALERLAVAADDSESLVFLFGVSKRLLLVRAGALSAASGSSFGVSSSVQACRSLVSPSRSAFVSVAPWLHNNTTTSCWLRQWAHINAEGLGGPLAATGAFSATRTSASSLSPAKLARSSRLNNCTSNAAVLAPLASAAFTASARLPVSLLGSQASNAEK